MPAQITAALLRKYDVPVPRYTSYPAVPHWQFGQFSLPAWQEALQDRFDRENGELSLYIHLPFCEELCTYCACNKRITRNHAVEAPYLDAVLKEWQMYLEVLGRRPVIRELHLGGGTPTFFSPLHIEKLVRGIMAGADTTEDAVFSVEAHPNNTTDEHLEALRRLGFNRISVGVQDFDPRVQFVINRMQSFEATQHVISRARALGFTSVNIDLVYGLPLQRPESVDQTMRMVEQLRPDRIAFYSYAHVPWKSKGQRRYEDGDVPKAEEKRAMFMLGAAMLDAMGYMPIGMDHFALPGDELLVSYQEGRLHRNFMGYTQHPSRLLVGLGASSISDTWHAFAQNEKEVEVYQEKISQGQWPLVNGHLLSSEDQLRRQVILDLMCRGEALLPETVREEAARNLEDALQDGLVIMEGSRITLTIQGRALVRNISAGFDQYIQRTGHGQPVFSRAI